MKLLKPLIAIALSLGLSVIAFAHPGRTDANGGHTDHSTGEYHYHHGEPAHQHTDTNGDGILECPYRINGSLDTPKKDTHSSTVRDDDSTKKSDSSKKKGISFEGIMLIAFGVLVVVGGVIDFVADKTKRKTKK